ncbi:MAG: hypothetical protein IT384_18435 [Deltaproteobacteria bacterium]|nr:hypothetical protein [Deltaproteobacteria bacterium]
MGGSFESVLRAALALFAFATALAAPIALLLLVLLSRLRGEPPRRRSWWTAALFVLAVEMPVGAAAYYSFNSSWPTVAACFVALVLATAWYQRSMVRAGITALLTTTAWLLAFQLGVARFARHAETPRLPDSGALVPCISPAAQNPEGRPKYETRLFWSPKGRFLWQGGASGFAGWDVQDLSRWQRWVGPFERSVGAGSSCELTAGWTPDAEHFFVADAAALRIWSADGVLAQSIPMPRPDNRLGDAWAPTVSVGAERVAQRDFHEARRVNVLEPRSKAVRRLEVPGPVERMTFLEDGRLVIWNPPVLSIADERGTVRSDLRLEGRYHTLLPGRPDHVFVSGEICVHREVSLSTGEITDVDGSRCLPVSPDLRFSYELDLPSQRLVILDRESGRPIKEEPPAAEPRFCAEGHCTAEPD